MKNYFTSFLAGIRIMKRYKNWLDVILNYLGDNKNIIEVVLRNGIRYKIRTKAPSTDSGIVQEIWLKNVYQIEEGDISDNATVIDIGAHIGIFSIFAANHAENVTVYAFEPESDNYQLLLENIRINDLENKIHPFNLAVSNSNASKKLIRSAVSLARHSFFDNKFLNNEQIKDLIEVNCITLESFFERNKIEKCDILKLDCEGGEYDILLNTPYKICSKIRRIAMEYHDGVTEYNHEDLENFLKERNFEVKTEKSDSSLTVNLGFLYAFNPIFTRGEIT